jgi:hypothetical protein
VELLPALANASGWAVAVFVLLFVIRALARGDLVPGPTHRHAIKRGDFWRDRALAGTSLAEAGADIVEAQADAE